jgi:hypothetical protein
LTTITPDCKGTGFAGNFATARGMPMGGDGKAHNLQFEWRRAGLPTTTWIFHQKERRERLKAARCRRGHDAYRTA